LHQGLIGAGSAGLDFSLLSTGVPEPGAATLLALGSLGLAAVRRTRRNIRPLI
jgi:MYXO-CTERM domain-containing protein